MNLIYPMFYKQYGIRRAQQMLSPQMRPFEEFEFPRGSIFHFVSHDPEVTDPDPAQTYFGFKGRRIMVDIVDNLTGSLGHPRRMNKPLNNLYRTFFQKNRLFKYMKDAYRYLHDTTTIMVVNYGYINELYRYTQMPMTDYYQWHNLEKTVWDKLKEVTDNSERQNFLFINIPKVLPSITTLRIFENKINNSMLKVLDTPEKRFILELWKWADPELSKNSVLGDLTQANLDKINLVFIANGQWCCVNFGLLAKWNKDKFTEKSEIHDIQLNHFQYQKFLLKFFIMAQTLSMSGEPQETAEEPSEPVEDPDREEGISQPIEPETDDDDSGEVATQNNTTSFDGLQYSQQVKTPSALNVPSPKVDDGIDNDGTIVFDDKLFQEIDEELETLRELEARNLVLVNKNEAGEEETAQKSVTYEADEAEHQALTQQVFTEKSSLDVLKQQINQQADYGMMSAKDYRTAINQIEKYARSDNPYVKGVSVEEFTNVKPEQLSITPESTKIPMQTELPDPGMANTTLKDFDKIMGEVYLPKFTVAMVSNIQRAGIIVQDHQVEKETTVLGTYESHTLKIKPIEGVNSTIHFRLPVVDKDGNFTANGNKYRLRKQRTDKPIRKINPFTTALSSYYGKVNVIRSTKKVNDSADWLCRQILGEGLKGDSLYIRKVGPANVFDNKFEAPKIYTSLAQHFKSIELKDLTLTFDHTEREKLMPADMLAQLEGEHRYRLVGATKMSNSVDPVFVDYDDTFYLYRNNSMIPIGTIYDLCHIPLQKSPIDFAELKVYSKTISLGLVLGYLMGFSNLIKLLGVKPIIVDSNKRVALAPNQWSLVFKDKKLIFSREDKLATLILAGLNSYQATRNFFLESFDNKNVYLNVLESQGIGARYIRELDLLDQLFVDPITKVLLTQMKEPVTFQGLLLRGADMLLTDLHPDSADINFQRIRGYERFSGAVYKEMVKSIREFKMRNIRGKSKIEMNPYAVWRNILEDPSKDLTREINPIQYLKEQEAVTYVGEGGRSKDAMDKKSRAYHKNDMGVISEATVDSADVGINSYLSANPQFTSILGTTKPLEIEKVGPTALLSTSALAAPGSDRDDGKRINFVSIQQSHTIACEGYRQPYLRTGYESVIPHRVSDMFAVTAKQSGKVIEREDRVIVVEYEDGTKEGVQLGRRYGKAEGSVYPHDIASPLKLGDTFQAGDYIAYNTGFFEPDFLNPKTLITRNNLVAKTVLYESPQTHEDASSISKEISDKLKTKTTKVKSIVINFKQGIRSVLKPGTKVLPLDTLFIIEEEITNDTGLFDENTIESLKRLSSNAPQAKVVGTVDRYEVFYHGAKEDMSPSLRSLANISDKMMSEVKNITGYSNGKVDGEYRVEGNPLLLDTAEIKVYITTSAPSGVGD